MIFKERVVSTKLKLYTLVAVFMLALLPRVLGLGGFLTTDEKFWIESSRDFLGGLLDSNFTCPAKTAHRGQLQLGASQGFACTLRAGHPGVLTMWSGSLGIWFHYLEAGSGKTLLEFIRTMPVKPVDKAVIPWVRLPTAVVTAGGVAAMFWLLVQCLKSQGWSGYFVAVIAAGLTALDPYEIALSRVLHTDALETTFLLLAVLAALYYWGHHLSRGWLLLSGGLAGLSFLAKSPALFLIPFIGLLGGWSLGRRCVNREGRSAKTVLAGVQAGLLWIVAAGVVYGLLWPALWVIPTVVWGYVFSVVFGYASDLDDKGSFFWGAFVLDPGPLFYPVSWLSRATPLAVLGLLPAGWFWLKATPVEAGEHRNANPRKRWLRWLGYDLDQEPIALLFFWSVLLVITFVAFLTVSETKEDRYLLPVYPFLNIIAAVGWVWLGERLLAIYPRLWARRLGAGFAVLALGLNGLLVALNFPYYFTYYNPLFGGLNVAQRIVPVGWGEGLDLAAAYLNEKPDAAKLKVASWYGASSFAPFFAGQTIDYYKQKGNVLAGDYVIIYIHQLQRHLPDSELFAFLDNYAKPEKVIEVGGIPYVWIYPGVGLDHHLEYDRYPDLAELLGWEYTTFGVDPNHPVLQPGNYLDFDLWWEYLGKSPEAPFFMWLVGQDNRIWVETTTRPKPAAGDPAGWSQGKIVPEMGRLVIPRGTPPGNYTLYLGFYPVLPPNPVTALLFGLGNNPRTLTIERGLLPGSLPPGVEPRDVEVGPLRLLGLHAYHTGMQPGEPFDLDLYWQALADITQHYEVRLALLDDTNVTRWEWERTDPVTFYPTQNWRQGELVRSQLTARPDLRTPGGSYQLALKLYLAENEIETIPLGPVEIEGRVRQFILPDDIEQTEGRFEQGIRLLGFRLARKTAYAPGDPLTVELFWQTQAPLAKDYTIFVQLLGSDGRLYGQIDTQPLQGAAPTSQWTPGEVIRDSYTFSIAGDTLPGNYHLIVGLYQSETGERLKIEHSHDDFLELPNVTVR